MRRLAGIVGPLAATLGLLVAAAPGHAALDSVEAVPGAPIACTAATPAPTRLELVIAGTPSYAYVALPPAAPRGLITYDHGYGDLPGGADQRRDLELIVRRTGAIVVAPVYRGTVETGPGTSRGAPLLAGAQDTIALARLYRGACGALPAVALGLSMGGTIAGLAAIEGAGLYDAWVGLNPMQDAITASLVARLAGATDFADDLDAEAGGTPLEAPAAYRRRSLYLRHPQLAASGIAGAVLIDASGDSSGAQLQSLGLDPLLRLAGLPLERHIALRRDAGGSAESDDFFAPLLGEASPFPGHLGLTSVRIAAERIAAFLDRGAVAPGATLHDPAL